MTRRIEIDFVSDVSCPWCVIGLRGLEEALGRLDGEVEAHIRFRPFELNPDMRPGGENKVENLIRKYGQPHDQVTANRQAISARAAAVGFDMPVRDEDRVYNTFDAHRLLHWAGLEGGQAVLKRALFGAYFTRGEDIGDPDVLAATAGAAGLDAKAAREVLASGRYADEVRADEGRWQAAGIHSVPAVVVNNRYLITGGQPAEAFENALRAIAAEPA
jgi:predicted DsbA family dithiol-disulfide isomerase